jgi:hypothetical protein
MWKLIVNAVLLTVAAPAAAQPIYFECSMSDSPAKADRREVTYDERSGSLTWDFIEGQNAQMTAVASGNVITATDEMGPDVKEVFTIDRATGAATSAFQINNQPPQPGTGICKQVAELPKFPHEQFRAVDYEFAAHFIALIQSHRLDDAKQMLAPNAMIRTWTDDEGVRRSLAEFARYITPCPVQEFEGVNTRATHNLNVNLDCPGQGGASLEFTGGKIATIRYGGPPPLIRTVTAPKQ